MNELISQSTSEGQPEVTGSLETKLREYIYNAITGSSSRLVISSMSQELPAAQNMEFEDYLPACHREHPDGGRVQGPEAREI